MPMLSSRGRCYATGGAPHCSKGGIQNTCDLTLNMNRKAEDYSEIKAFTMKNIPDTDSMSRLTLSGKG